MLFACKLTVEVDSLLVSELTAIEVERQCKFASLDDYNSQLVDGHKFGKHVEENTISWWLNKDELTKSSVTKKWYSIRKLWITINREIIYN